MVKEYRCILKAISEYVQSINDIIKVPGDKSISHRALILSSQAVGITRIFGILKCQDVLCTKKNLNILGVKITDEENDIMSVQGVSTAGLCRPIHMLNMEHSATTARLMMGLLATYSFTSFFTGNSSLLNRPVDRVIEPLYLMGARFVTDNKRLPLCMIGCDETIPITYTMNTPSAQVKSAILLAALSTAGITTIIEPIATRNHTEIMLKNLGADILTKLDKSLESNIITLRGQVEFYAKDIIIPADPSSVAFFVAAAIMLKGSEILITDVLVNPTRMGFYQVLLNMGANITFLNYKNFSGEEVADILVKSSKLIGVNIPSKISASMIDEYPIMSIVAAYADGVTIMNGLSELKIKESNRFKVLFTELNKCEIKTEIIDNDNLVIYGTNDRVKGGKIIETSSDHRIAMSFLVLGMISKDSIIVDDIECIDKSFPNFIRLFNYHGAKIKVL